MIPLNQIIISLNNFLGIDHYSQSVRLVLVFLIVVFVTIMLLSLFTVMILVFHKINTSITKKYHVKFHELLINYALDPSSPLPTAPSFQRDYLRNSILDILLVTKGFERSVLHDVYKQNGFWDEDLKKLMRFRWYKRLGALVRLDQWQVCLGQAHLADLLIDKNIQIRQIAIKNLSRTYDAKEAEYLIEVLLSQHFFHSTTYECIHRLIQNHYPLILKVLDDQKKIKLWPFIIKAIGNMRVIEATPKLVEIASTAVDRSSKEKALVALGKIGDPRSIEVLKYSLLSDSPTERLEALQSLYNIDPSQVSHYKKVLENDSDPVIKNWISFYMRTSV